MEALRKETVASVELVEARISEDELAVYESALNYVLDKLEDVEIKRLLGATRNEVEGIRDDLHEVLHVQDKTELLVEMSEKS